MAIGEINNVVKRVIGDKNYFYGQISSDKVKNVTFVPVLENSPKTPLVEEVEDGYQRPGTLTRMNKFKDFLEDNPGSLVPPVLLSGRGNWVYTPSSDNEYIGSISIEGSAAILDGQHRLGGFVQLFEKKDETRSIDFLLLENLTLEEEIKEFVVVNNTQVGVPKSLNEFIGQDIEGLERIIGTESQDTWLAWQLNTREDSPFQGKITRIKLGPEQLFQLHSVSKNIFRTFKDGAFDALDRDQKLDILIKYWNMIASSHPTEWADIGKLGVKGEGRKKFSYKLLELTGFITWSLIADSRILSICFNASSETMDWDRVQEMIEVLSDKVDWDKEGEFGGYTGEVGGKRIVKEMQNILAKNL